MIFTTYYQQRQMQKASPPGASTQQQQTIMKLMPIMFGVFGFTFPAGLVVYWTVANVWQIGQQYALLKLGHIGPEALEKRIAEQRAKGDQPAKKGLMSRFMESAEAERQKRGKDAPAPTRKSQRPPSPGTPRRRPNTGKGGPSTKRTPPPKGTPPKEPRRKPGGDDDA